MSTDLHVVLGASGGAGNAIARALLEAGHTVRGVNRSGTADLPGDVGMVAADITTTAGITSAVAGAAVVYMAAQPQYHRWPEEFPAMLDNVVRGTAAVGARLVMVDNLYAYGPGASPMTEQSPERATDKKGIVRKEMANSLLAAHRRGDLRVTIGRASDYFGPRAENSGITALAIAPATSGGRLRWLGSLDAPHSVAYLPDIARAYVALGTSDAADGHIWILPHGKAVTGGEFLAGVNAVTGRAAKVGVVSKFMLQVAAPFHRISRESLPLVYQWSEPFVADDSKFQGVFGPFAATPLEEAIRTSLPADVVGETQPLG